MVSLEHIIDAASEAGETLLGGRIEKVWCLDDYTFLLIIRSKSSNLFLVISVLKRSRRFHLVFDPVEKDHLYTSAKTDIINKHIRGGRIKALFLSDGCLAVEIRRGDIYTLLVDFERFNVVLRNQDNQDLFTLHKRSIPDVLKPRELGHPMSSTEALSVNIELGNQFKEERDSWLKRDLSKVVKAEERKVQRLIGKLLKEKEEIERKEQYRLFGELLKYNLNNIKRGSQKAVLKNFDGNEIEIELDARLSPAQNMELYFKRYRKLSRKEELLTGRIEEQSHRLEHIKSLHNKISDEGLVGLHLPLGSLLESPEVRILGKGFKEKLAGSVVKKQKAKPSGEKKSIRRFLSESGKIILVGRSADENDELIRRIARGNDMWFHAEAAPGSYVILRYEKGMEFTEEDIRDACMLALHYSKSKAAGAGEIVYTRCKWVRKPKGAKKGLALYYNNKTKYVTYDKKVIEKLFDEAYG
jgi:predicted ribosome quality control (RQC) complex YloA/Tae2 family protein